MSEKGGEDGRARTVAAAARAFAEVTPSEATLLDTIARLVAAAVNGSCAVALVSDDRKWLETLIELDAEAPAIASGSFIGRPRRGMADDDPMVRALSSDEPVLGVTATDAATLSVALRARRVTWGAIQCTSRTGTFGADQVDLVRDLADHAALAIANNRHIRRLEDEVADGRGAAEAAAAGRFLDAIVENLPHMIFVKDADRLAFVRFNRAGEELLGVPRADLIGKNDYDFFPRDEAEFFQEKDRETLRGKMLVDIPEEPIQTRRGLRWLHTKKVPILDEHGLPAYLLGISEDITDRKKAEQELRSLATALSLRGAELEAANKELEAFTYSVSHDLRAPLRAIDGFSRVLIEDHGPQLSDEARRLLAIVRKNTQAMGNLIDDLLIFARLGRQPLRAQRVEMAPLVRAVVDDLRAGAAERSVEVEVGDLPGASCDPTLIRQVWVNLIGNAFKYTRPRPAGRIEISGAERDSEVVYTVSDNGVGFDMRYAHKLFGVFQRLHAADEFEGTGVGLALVHRIVQRHGGRIWAQGEIDRGATFSFALPAD
ncbi:MAG TPA: ATP-binding protein [Kofleriaceae bacterium]|nr:ATP-binding protein [Kofleriaceae bacterium]